MNPLVAIGNYVYSSETRGELRKNPKTAQAATAAGTFLPTRLVLFVLLAALSAPITRAQQPTPAAPPQPTVPDQSEPAAPSGKVLFSRDAATQPATSEKPHASMSDDMLAVTDAERTALTFTVYDLDVHLTPASSGISARAGLTVRNDGTAPLSRLILQITSSMNWNAISTLLPSSPGTVTPLHFAVQRVDTDADHTGQMNEAVVALPQPLAPGASMPLIVIYAGAIPVSTERLTRIGAPNDQAISTDWDAISASDPSASPLPTGVALRGFGNVLWYPVSAPPLFLGDAAKLFQAVGNTKLRESTATVRLRISVEYSGDAPDAAYFCGRREQLIAISDNPDMPAAESPGIATAVFAPQPLGFRTPDLFITGSAATDIGTSANPGLIAAVTDHNSALPSYSAAAALAEPLLFDWFGPQPNTPLTILDHPGQPFEDGALLVRPLRPEQSSDLANSLAHSLTHAWIHSSHPWIDEGLAQFASLLWAERTAGRAATLSELQDAARTLALAEPENPDATPAPIKPAGASLISATGDIFYRTKAAAVWWMLRSIVGDDALKQALQTYRHDPKLDHDPAGFQQTLEKASHKDLRWFFNDWVYRDRGLPDLSIASITPSVQVSRSGQPDGWLVAVVVRNDGYAEAEVPVTVRSSVASQTTRLRIPGRSSVSTRVLFAGTPTDVEVNDGSVPETQASIHTRQLILPTH